MLKVPLAGRTIPHEIEVKYGASRVLLRPAAPGTGVIAGGGVRAVVEAAGIHDILAKSLGSNNPVNVVRATLKALRELESGQDVSRRRSKRVESLAERRSRELQAAGEATH
jgi:small subunit ribosomal protein S5